MKKQTQLCQVAQEQIYRSVASSTAIETSKPVQEIELQLERNRKLAKPLVSPANPELRFK